MTALPYPPILVITDRMQCAEPLEVRAAALFRGGCRWLSLREKDLEPEQRRALLERLIAHMQARGQCWFATHAEVAGWCRDHAADAAA